MFSPIAAPTNTNCGRYEKLAPQLASNLQKEKRAGPRRDLPAKPKTMRSDPNALEDQQRYAGSRFRRSLARRHRLLRVHRPVVHAGVAQVNLQIRGTWQGPLNQRLRQRIFNELLQRPPQRPRTIAPVRTSLLQNVLGGVRRQVNLDLL